MVVQEVSAVPAATMDLLDGLGMRVQQARVEMAAADTAAENLVHLVPLAQLGLQDIPQACLIVIQEMVGMEVLVDKAKSSFAHQRRTTHDFDILDTIRVHVGQQSARQKRCMARRSRSENNED